MTKIKLRRLDDVFFDLVVVMELKLALVCVGGCEVCIGLHFLSIVHYNDCGCKNSNNIDCGSN